MKWFGRFGLAILHIIVGGAVMILSFPIIFFLIFALPNAHEASSSDQTIAYIYAAIFFIYPIVILDSIINSLVSSHGKRREWAFYYLGLIIISSVIFYKMFPLTGA